MKFAARTRRPRAALDLTPMLDVTFNLILFFVVTTQFASEQQPAPDGLQVDLPRAAAAQVLPSEASVDLTVGAEGTVFVDGTSVDRAQLRARLQAAAERDPNTLVVLRADRGVAHGEVVSVMDLARTLGLTRLAIATDPEAEASAP